MIKEKLKIICVVGPTASGKTSLGVKIAEEYNGEIISADSMQIYKGIHIASAAPDESEKSGIPHHLIEILPVTSAFSVADYVHAASQKIEEISEKGKMPVIVGGTGLYINSLIEGINFVPEPSNLQLRKRLQDEMKEKGSEKMLEELKKFDPQTAERLHLNDERRIIRAFEIFLGSGKTQTQANLESRGESPYDALIIGLTCRNREKLYDRINSRVDLMIQKGLVEEAKTTLDLKSGGAVQAIGHKELYGYLNGEISINEAVENLKRATRRYAKRQLTWFRRIGSINWIYTDETENPAETARNIINEWRNNECGELTS